MSTLLLSVNISRQRQRNRPLIQQRSDDGLACACDFDLASDSGGVCVRPCASDKTLKGTKGDAKGRLLKSGIDQVHFRAASRNWG